MLHAVCSSIFTDRRKLPIVTAKRSVSSARYPTYNMASMSAPSTVLLATLLIVVSLASLVYARALHNQTGIPDLATTVFGAAGADEGKKRIAMYLLKGLACFQAVGIVGIVFPWPGVSWLEGLASSSTSFTLNDQHYASAYEAILSECSPGTNADAGINPVKNFNAYINSFIIPHSLAKYIVLQYGTFWSHHIITYLRNLISGMIVYYGTGAFFHYHCYIHPRSKEIFKNRKRPEWSLMVDQMKLATASMFIYVMLPGLSEFLIEEGYTKCVYTFDEMGGFAMYLFWMTFYFMFVEIGIYWMHRTLHENKTLYKYIHGPHHAYSKPDTLTPWASVAFHPLDGMLQASPYVLLLPFITTHYLTHIIMVFLTAVWATYIHDAMDWNIDPIMGSKYHTVHHTHYIYNYGQVFTFCDRIWGTLRVPLNKTGIEGQRVKLKVVPGIFGKGRGGKAKST